MIEVPPALGFVTLALSLASVVVVAVAYVKMLRMRRQPPPAVMCPVVVFRDANNEPIATIAGDGTTVVHQPDKIRGAADALVDHLATEAAKAAAEKEFGSAP